MHEANEICELFKWLNKNALSEIALRSIETFTRLMYESKEKLEEYKADTDMQKVRCFARKKDDTRCTHKAPTDTKLCFIHKNAEVEDWPEEEVKVAQVEQQVEKDVQVAQKNIIRAALNGVFYLPNTSYRLDKDQYVISRDTFHGDKMEVQVNPLTQKDIEWLKSRNKKYRIVDWENRHIEDIPETEILKDMKMEPVEKTKIIPPKPKRHNRYKPHGEDSDCEEPKIPDDVYLQLMGE